MIAGILVGIWVSLIGLIFTVALAGERIVAAIDRQTEAIRSSGEDE